MKTAGYWVLNMAQALFLGLWSALWITIAAFVSLFDRELPLVLARRAWAPGLIWASLVEVRLVESATLDPSTAYVFVMNHQSMFDIAVAFRVIPRNLRFVAKRVLRLVPFLGFYMWRTGMVFVDRRNPGQAYERLDEAVARLRQGACFIAYPEGTRSTDGCIKPFKRGPFLTALRAGAPIVPVAIEGSSQVLPRGGFRLRPGVVRVRIGEPIPTAGAPEERVRDLVQAVRSELIRLHHSIGGRGGAKGDRRADIGLVARFPVGDDGF